MKIKSQVSAPLLRGIYSSSLYHPGTLHFSHFSVPPAGAFKLELPRGRRERKSFEAFLLSIWNIIHAATAEFEGHTRPFGYPPKYSGLVNFRASRGIKRLQRVDCPLQGWNSTPPEACFASGGPCIPLEGRVSLWRHVEGLSLIHI